MSWKFKVRSKYLKGNISLLPEWHWLLKKLGDSNLLPGPVMNNFDVLGRDSNMRHSKLKLTVLSTAVADEKSSCNCCILIQSIPLFPVLADLIGGWKNCQICIIGQADWLHPCFFSIWSKLRKSILSEFTNDGRKYSWFGMRAHTCGKCRNLSKHWALLAATNVFQDFHASGYKRQQDLVALWSGFWVFT